MQGYGVLTDGVVVDLTEGFNTYEAVGDDIVVAGSGIRLGPLYFQAWKDDLAFPGGVCPHVGLAGLSMGAYESEDCGQGKRRGSANDTCPPLPAAYKQYRSLLVGPTRLNQTA